MSLLHVLHEVREHKMKLLLLSCLLVACGGQAGAARREYYIGITETAWNYAPGNTSTVSGQLLAEEE